MPPATTVTMTMIKQVQCKKKTPKGRWIGHGIDAVWMPNPGATIDELSPGETTDESSQNKQCKAKTKNKQCKAKAKNKQKQTRASLTDAQRSAAALAYFIAHYPEEWERELKWRRTGDPTVLIRKPPINWEEMVEEVNKLADDGGTTQQPLTDKTPWTWTATPSKQPNPIFIKIVPQCTHKAITPLTPTTPQYRRAQQLRQLRLINRNKFKTKGKTAPPRSPTQPTAASQQQNTTHTPLTLTPLTQLNAHISPITTHITHHINTTSTPNLTPTINQTTPNLSLNAYQTMNDSLDETTLNITPTSLFDHSDIMNDTQSPRHMQNKSDTHIYISHEPL